MRPEISSEIEKIIASADVVLFMKGAKEGPMCGFSSFVVSVLKNSRVEFGAYVISNVMALIKAS